MLDRIIRSNPIINNIKLTLGSNSSPISIITSAILVLITFFYIFTFASYFEFGVHFFKNGIVYNAPFLNKYVINEYTDHIVIVFGTILWFVLSIRIKKANIVPSATYAFLVIVAISTNFKMLFDFTFLISIPLMVSFLIYNIFASENKKILERKMYTLFVTYSSLVWIGTGLTSIIISLSPLVLSTPLTTVQLPDYAYLIQVLFSNLSPLFIFLLTFCFFLKLLITEFKLEKLMIASRFNFGIGSIYSNITSISKRKKIIFISLFILLSISLSIIPHQPPINKNNQKIGVDSNEYVKLENVLIKSHNIQEFIRQSFAVQSGGDRPITLIFLFLINKIIDTNSLNTVEYLPVILGPSLILVIYFLTREITSNDITSLFAAFLTAISFHMLIGIYAGFYANWLALIIGYLSFVFLFKFLKTSSKQYLIIYSLLMLLLLFSHVYTWTIFTIVTGIFLLLMLKLNLYNRKRSFLLLLVVLSIIVIDISRMVITGSSSSGIQEGIYAAKVDTGLDQFTQRWSNLVFTAQISLGGLFSNFILYTLGLYWLFKTNLKEPSTILIMIFLSISIIPLFFGGTLIQARVFYDIPFQIPAAIALNYIKKNGVGTLIVLSICIWILSITVRDIVNMYLILPS